MNRMRLQALLSIALGVIVAMPLQAQSSQPAKPWGLWSQVWAPAFGDWTLESLTSVPSPGEYVLDVTTAPSATLSGGPQLQPFATNASIVIDPGTDQEIVTPSAVSCSSGQNCRISVILSKSHNYHFSIESGTDGLQEAINYTKAHGGVVHVGQHWTGNTAMIVNAAGASNVEIVDTQSGETDWYTWNGSHYQVALGIGGSSPNGSATAAVSAITVSSPAITPTSVVGTRVAEGYADLAAAVSAVGSAPATLTCSTPQSLSANLTIPANVTFAPRCVTKLNGHTLTLESSPAAGAQQIFDMSAGGAVVIDGADAVARPEWFSPNTPCNGTTDESAYLQYAANAVAVSGGIVRLGACSYAAHGLNPPNNVRWAGAGGTTELVTHSGALFAATGPNLVGASWANLTAESASGGGTLFDFSADAYVTEARFTQVNMNQTQPGYAAIYAPTDEWLMNTWDGGNLTYPAAATIPAVDIVGQPQHSAFENMTVHGPGTSNGTFAFWVEASCGGCESAGVLFRNVVFEEPGGGAINLLSIQQAQITGGGVYDLQVNPAQPIVHLGTSTVTASLPGSTTVSGWYSNADIGSSWATPDIGMTYTSGTRLILSDSTIGRIAGLGTAEAGAVELDSTVSGTSNIALTNVAASGVCFDAGASTSHTYCLTNGSPGQDDGYLVLTADGAPVGSVSDTGFQWGPVTSPAATISTAGNAAFASVQNACSGSIALVAGSATTAATACLVAGRPVSLSVSSPGGTQGFLSYSESGTAPGITLTIQSTSSTDTSTVSWVQN